MGSPMRSRWVRGGRQTPMRPTTRRMGGVIAAIAVLVLSTASVADMDEKRGYWWKKEPPPVQEPEIQDEYPELGKPPSEEELLAMHPEQFKEMLEDYRQFALWKMTPEHVTWYYQLQDYARRRSRAFMNVTEVVMLQNADLNMNTEYPLTPPGMKARNQKRESSLQSLLQRERNNAALIMLTRATCEYCEAQRGILRYFQQKHGWQVREIDVDENPQAAARFATEYTPTTLVIFRGTNQWFPVAVGVESLPRIEESIYRAVRQLKGETTPTEFTLQEYQEGGLLDPTR